jgi:hypothetical protein
MCLDLETRNFFCDTPGCSRRIFAERLPATVAPYRRRTLRLHGSLRLMSLVAGGEAGARQATMLGMGISGGTLLSCIRQPAALYPLTPRVLGVDDWAWRNGHSYRTILCDLERKTAVDLLPDRTAESLAEWLRRWPVLRSSHVMVRVFMRRQHDGVHPQRCR